MSTPREQGIALLKGPYGREIGNLASAYTSVLFWFAPGETPQINHGCIFFLDLGRGPFAVTANHVYEAYLERRRAEVDLWCQIGNRCFVPEDRLIDHNPDLDLATFRMEEREISADGKIVHRVDPTGWPPKPPDLDKGVFFAGYPQVHRKTHGAHQVEWGTHVGVLTATSVRERDVICQFHREEMVDMFGTGVPPQGQWLGGLSGTPLWTLVQTAIFSWRLAGILYQFGGDFEIIYARRPDSILPDGHLLR